MMQEDHSIDDNPRNERRDRGDRAPVEHDATGELNQPDEADRQKEGAGRAEGRDGPPADAGERDPDDPWLGGG